MDRTYTVSRIRPWNDVKLPRPRVTLPAVKQTLKLRAFSVFKMRSAKISDTSLRYLAALYDSRSATEPPSVPKSTQLSRKVKVFVRSSFATGTTGFGFVSCAPAAMLASNANALVMTSSTSVMTPTTAFGATTNLLTGASNAEFATTSFTGGVGSLSWKLTSLSLHVKYAGTRLNKGGDMVMFEDPQHANVTATTYNTALSYDMSKRVEVSDEWQHVCWTPSVESESDFANSSLNASANWNPVMGVVINSAGASQPFDVECYCWFEVVGVGARGATQSYQDPIGWGAIDGAINQFGQLDSVVGPDGLITAVETQLSNFSGVHRSVGKDENFAGLAAFLPSIATLADKAMPYVRKAAGGAISALTAKDVKAPPPARPPRVQPPPGGGLQPAATAAKKKKKKAK